MAAFYSVVTLEQLLNQLSNSDQLLKEELVPLLEKITSLKSSLENIFPAPRKEREEAHKLATEITEKIFEAQDKIEPFIFTKSNPSAASAKILKGQILAYIDPIVDEAKKLGDSIKAGKKYSHPVDESETYKSSATGKRTKIVGQEKHKARIEDELLASTSRRQVIPICGMGCIGKTTLAKSIYEDDTFMNNFSCKAWVTVSQVADVQQILGKLLHSLESRGRKAGDNKYEGDEAKLRLELHQALSNNKYLVVIDDMWYIEIWRKIITALPDNENSSRVLLTTRAWKVARSVNSGHVFVIEPLNEEDSWTLLRNRTFGDDKECPESLENIGRKIVRHCKGLPLSLTLIGGLLSQGSKEAEYWQSIEQDAYEATAYQMIGEAYLSILILSYDNLPCKLKACLLYMGAFPDDSDIPVSKLIRLWVAQGFLTIAPPLVVDKVAEISLAEQSLLDLIDRNLVFVNRNKSNGKITTCGMHQYFNYLAAIESHRDMYSYFRRGRAQKPDDNTDFQRHASVHRNIMICLEDVYNSTTTIEKASSLLYVGPHQHHPMPFSINSDLPSVIDLDAFTIYFIRFPDEFLKAVHLKYLSFTYDGRLPSTTASLRKLQVVIVKRQPKILFVGMPFLPYEIWRTKEPRHLPTEPPGTILVDKLHTLTNVNADSCYEKVLERAASLKRLGMWMEGPKEVDFHINKLDHLEIFKFVVLNPSPNPCPKAQPKFYFPSTVRKLSLSGTGLPWEEMEAIAALPNLQVLKLKELAFHGEEWRPTYTFVKLEYLLIEYLNLRKWEADSSHFPSLEQLIFRHCYELEEFPSDIQRAERLQLIELVDCSPNAEHWAEGIKRDVEDFGQETPKVSIYSSWE